MFAIIQINDIFIIRVSVEIQCRFSFLLCSNFSYTRGAMYFRSQSLLSRCVVVVKSYILVLIIPSESSTQGSQKVM